MAKSRKTNDKADERHEKDMGVQSPSPTLESGASPALVSAVKALCDQHGAAAVEEAFYKATGRFNRKEYLRTYIKGKRKENPNYGKRAKEE
jgi:hypothetical protein